MPGCHGVLTPDPECAGLAGVPRARVSRQRTKIGALLTLLAGGGPWIMAAAYASSLQAISHLRLGLPPATCGPTEEAAHGLELQARRCGQTYCRPARRNQPRRFMDRPMRTKNLYHNCAPLAEMSLVRAAGATPSVAPLFAAAQNIVPAHHPPGKEKNRAQGIFSGSRGLFSCCHTKSFCCAAWHEPCQWGRHTFFCSCSSLRADVLVYRNQKDRFCGVRQGVMFERTDNANPGRQVSMPAR